MRDLYIVSHNADELFELSTMTFIPNTIDRSVYEMPDCQDVDYIGIVLEKKDGVFSIIELTDDERDALSTDALAKVLDQHIEEKCTGMIVYHVACWAMGFNRFQYSFTNFHFEV